MFEHDRVKVFLLQPLLSEKQKIIITKTIGQDASGIYEKELFRKTKSSCYLTGLTT